MTSFLSDILPHKSAGAWAEQRAARLLARHRHKILTRNFHCRFGEIDLITHDPQGTVVFVEVRFRTDSGFASAVESITLQKQNRLRKSAQTFLAKHPSLADKPCRFDVITLQRLTKSGKINTDWLQNAFY